MLYDILSACFGKAEQSKCVQLIYVPHAADLTEIWSYFCTERRAMSGKEGQKAYISRQQFAMNWVLLLL